jgi:hypothetical protein
MHEYGNKEGGREGGQERRKSISRLIEKEAII